MSNETNPGADSTPVLVPVFDMAYMGVFRCLTFDIRGKRQTATLDVDLRLDGSVGRHANSFVMIAVAMAISTAPTIFARCSRHHGCASAGRVTLARCDRTV